MIVLPNYGPSSESTTGPMVDGNAAAAPYKALQSVASGIADVGQAAGGIASKMQAATNEADVLKVRRQLGERQAAFELELAKDHQPGGYLARAESELIGPAGELISPEMSDVVKDRLNLEYEQWASDAKIATKAAAARKAVEINVAELRLLRGPAIEHDKPEAFLAAVDESTTLLPEEKKAALREFDRDRAIHGMKRRIEDDPIGMLNDLDSPDFTAKHPDAAEIDPDNLDRLKRLAAEKANQAKAAIWDNVLNDSLNEGEDQAILSKDDLRMLAEDGTITPEQRASYLNAYHGSTPPPFDPHLYNEAFGAISKYDPASDPTGATLATLRGNLATLALPKEYVAELRDRLAARVKVENPTAHKMAGDFAKLNEDAFNAGRFGNWFSLQDTDGNPQTRNAKVINFADYGRALATKRRFTDTFDAWLRNQGDDLDPVKAQEVHAELFEKIVLDQDDPQAAPLVPAAPPLIDFGRDVDKLLGTPSAAPGAPAAGKETSSTRRTFGGQAIQPPGTFYRNARPTIFGGKNDPADNGLSAFGGTTGTGGKEGVAIPFDILKATFPGKDKAWMAANVKVAVKTADGRQAVLPVADLGTAEWVWQRDRRPVLDLTEGAVKALGGRPLYKDGKLAGVSGLGSLSFALTTDNVGTEQDLRGMAWPDVQDAFFKDKKPTNADQIASGLAAVRSAWLAANLEDDDSASGTTGPEPEPWGDGTGGTVLPDKP